jgi:ethanolamine phosphate phosphodiesterase
LVFIADPQLIDPHSYPDRLWLLQKLTISHTDNYLKRSYIQLQKYLHPDTLFFLGDLFDGGREWKTAHGGDDDPEWAAAQRPAKEKALLPMWRKKYGEDFWLREYNRFGKIFFEHWNDGGTEPGAGQRGRKIIASLPGNHDLGFGAKIKVPVRNRFQAYFGDTNRVDVIGNHTFVSIDAVSLSARVAGEEDGVDTRNIYEPVEEFLRNVQSLKRKAMARELRYQNRDLMDLRQEHKVVNLSSVDFSHLPSQDPGASSSFPTVLLTHVPLYRPPGKPCGPFREHWPPTPRQPGQTQPVDPDDRNAISISKGYQYQNVLSDTDSKMLVSAIGDVVSVFSGDDHDYCEVVHPDKNNVREITVKSMSWAMGVRKPGFLMLSMWNPVDASGVPLGTLSGGHGATSSTPATTIESHLCLLPDQIGILIRYGVFAGLTLLCLLTGAILTGIGYMKPFAPVYESLHPSTILPTYNRDRKNRELEESPVSGTSNSSTTSTSSVGGANLAPRNTTARTRSVSPTHGGYGLPTTQASYVPPVINGTRNGWTEKADEEEHGWKETTKGARRRYDVRKLGMIEMVFRETIWSVWRVAWVVILYYVYLARHG